MKKTMQNLIKNKIFIGIFGVLVIFFGLSFKKSNIDEKDVFTVERGSVLETVSLTGKVKAKNFVNLGFDRAGRVGEIYKKVGDKVLAGEIIVALESEDIKSNIVNAEANKKGESARLSELKRGLRKEEYTVEENKLNNAKTDLDNAKKDLNNAIIIAFTRADDAVRGKTDKMFSNPRSSNPEILLYVNNFGLEAKIENSRLPIEEALLDMKSITDLTSVDKKIENILKIENYLAKIKDFLDNMSIVVTGLSTTNQPNLSNSELEVYKTDIYNARISLNTAIDALITSKNNLENKKSLFALALEQFNLKNASATVESLDTQESKVEEASANIDKYNSDLRRTYIIAPFSGVVSKVDVEKGEIVGAGEEIVALINADEFIIESFVPEREVSKVSLDQNAKVTLDAYGEKENFNSKIIEIDPAETMNDGVATYRIKIIFIEKDNRIKSGMTANIKLETKRREDVLILPSRFIIKNEDKNFVYMVGGEKREIKVGVKGDNSNIEILEGLQEGEKVEYITQ